MTGEGECFGELRNLTLFSLFRQVCNVNGMSTTYQILSKIMNLTGFKEAGDGEEVQLGKWFREVDHGTSLPSFISPRSFQRSTDGDFNGWKFNRAKNYPSLWILPENSIILTIYGQELVASEEYSVGISLRFARIDKVRIDGDEKPLDEISTDNDLLRMYEENLRNRSDSTTLADSTFSPGGQASQSVMAPSARFLTPDEYKNASKKRKRKTIVSPSKVPKVEKKESWALKGVALTILEGKYSLDPNSLDAQEANEQGWYDKVIAVRSKEDVMEFVDRHGGTIMVSANGGDTLIVGGSQRDARVVNHMRGIDYARSLNIQKPKTKKEQQQLKLSKSEGVLKWTFVFSLVHRWLAERSQARPDRDDGDGMGLDDYGGFPCIKATSPNLLQPTKHNFLVLSRSTVKEKLGDDIFNLDNKNKLTLIDLRRGLEELQETPVENPLPWQYVGIHSMAEENRWALSCLHQSLWPYRARDNSEEGNRVVVLYPDIFRSEFGLLKGEEAVHEVLSGFQSERWENIIDNSNSIDSTLPLARAMGALVTAHLHSGVSHILCDLEGDREIVVYTATTEVGIFSDQFRGQNLLERLAAFQSSDQAKKIMLVSPKWIRANEFWQRSK
jgi:hypothetical protein